MKHRISYQNLSQELLKKQSALFEQNILLLEEYAERLLWWNKRINLVSRDVSHETIKEHVLHSLLLGGGFEEVDLREIIDTGTGGGLPGIPLAICYPDKKFLLNDIVSKKMMAVKETATHLGLKNVHVNTGSIANVEINKGEVIISKHAFKINQLLSLIEEKAWGEIILLKGEKEVPNELEGIKEKLDIEVIGLEDALEKDFYIGKAIVRIKRKLNE
ncbi:MAG: 16S rRNA (guanine(527)-N(7))-methyltransferase RsmG [Balneola sp.]